MRSGYKRALRIISIPIYVFVIGELTLRVLSSFVLFFDMEMIDYATKVLSDSPVPNVTHQQTPDTNVHIMGVDLVLNSLGHRSVELSPTKPANEYRVQFIGSSITLGWGVNVEDGFAEVTTSLLNAGTAGGGATNFVAINAGTADYNTAYNVRSFIFHAPKTDPDLVVIQYHLNDARPDPVGGANPILRYSVFAAFVFQKVASLQFLAGRTLSETYSDVYQDNQPSWLETQSELQDLVQFVKSNNIKVVGILIPELHDLSPNSPFIPIYDAVENRLEEIGIPLINPFPELADAFGSNISAAMVATGDPHPSVLAHNVIAQKLVRFLSAKPGYLPEN